MNQNLNRWTKHKGFSKPCCFVIKFSSYKFSLFYFICNSLKKYYYFLIYLYLFFSNVIIVPIFFVYFVTSMWIRPLFCATIDYLWTILLSVNHSPTIRFKLSCMTTLPLCFLNKNTFFLKNYSYLYLKLYFACTPPQLYNGVFYVSV